MNNLIDIFAPYIPFTVFLLTIIINILYLFKGGNWITFIILNIIITVILNTIALTVPALDGLIQYDLISIIVRELTGFIADFFSGIGKGIGDWFSDLFSIF